MEVGYVYGGTQTVPNGTNELQEEVVPMLVVSAPVIMPSIGCQACTRRLEACASWRVPYNQPAKGEKTRAWFADDSVCYAGTTQN